MRRVSYVPTAALVVRREALTGTGFDEELRFGEDVDLVWRLHGAGWTVRYDPSVEVRHSEPVRWRDLLARHYRYGTSAADLAARHPGQLGPLLVEPWAAVLGGCVLMGPRRVAAVVAAIQMYRVAGPARRAGVGAWTAAAWPLRGAWQMTLAMGHALAMFAPLALVGATVPKRSRQAALALLIGPPLVEWAQRRPALDPLRWTVLALADDAAYGMGVWVGCARRRTLGPVLPTWAPAWRRRTARAGLRRSPRRAGDV
jgi:hypothetical protein